MVPLFLKVISNSTSQRTLKNFSNVSLKHYFDGLNCFGTLFYLTTLLLLDIYTVFKSSFDNTP